jgi:hypothetical protein
MNATQGRRRRSLATALVFGTTFALVPTSARAHFVLDAPASWAVLDQTSGLPEKLGPCGNEGPTTLTLNDAGLPIVTAFQEGDKITITITEVVFHPGHYRISLSTDWADAGDAVQAGFPDDPVVTPGDTNSGTMQCQPDVMSSCGSVPIVQQTPVEVRGVGWILADDVFEHCDAFTNPQTITVALPTGVTCKECVIQVLEFMSAHGLNVPGGCFYHHCANISILGKSVPVDAGGSESGGGSSGTPSREASGPSSGGTMTESGATAAGPTTGSTASTGTGSATAGGSITASSSGATGVGTAPAASPSSGGGCSVLPRRASFGAAGLAGLGLAAWLVRRRRR